MSSPNKDNSIIVKDIHCPYCDSDNALLINRAEAKKVSLQLPAFGLKTVLSAVYLSLVHVWIHGWKLIEAKKEIENVTYGFCPNCGNGYSMSPPESVKAEAEEPRFCKIRDGKVIMGLCKGISEYTGISILWIRIMTVIYGLTIIGALLYFLIGACIPFQDELNCEIPDKRFYRINKGKDVMGLCKGFAEYTGIPVMWVRIFTLMGGCTGIGAIAYFIVGAFIPIKEDVELGIQKKKLYKVKKGKVLFGLCTGLAEYSGIRLWAVRLLTVLFLSPIYFVLAAIIPTQETDYYNTKKFRRARKGNGKVIMGVCAGFAKYTGCPLWLVRLLTIILIVPLLIYFIIALIVPEED